MAIFILNKLLDNRGINTNELYEILKREKVDIKLDKIKTTINLFYPKDDKKD